MTTHDRPTSTTPDADVLERNVETLLETGGEAPRLTGAARTRIRAHLIERHGVAPRRRSRAPLLAIGAGLAVTAIAALIITNVGGGDAPRGGTIALTEHALADGSTWIAEPGAKVTVLGERRVRVEGAALLDVVPGKGTFVVETARGRIEVIGTRFLVDAEADRTTAAVVRGQVRLATSEGDVLLHAGEQGVAEPGRPPTRGPAPRLSHLVSWAAQARRRAEHATTPLRTGALFARDPGVRGNGQLGPEYPLPLVKLGVDIVVENQVARVALDQTFHNAESRVLEGVYRFAIPPDAALQRLAMYVDGTLTESAVVERQRARRIYEELVYRRVDPALLEWEGTGRLSLRVYPLPAHQHKRLMLAYTQSIPKLYSDWSLSVPLPEIDQPVGEVAFDVTIRGCANCEITSTSHAITVDRKDADAIVTYRGEREQIGDSLVLRVRDHRAQTTVTTHQDGGDSYLMVRAPAELERKARAYRPRTWVILDDVSASRGAMERAAQTDLIDAFVRELDEEDRLAVIAFDVTAREKLAPTRVLDIDRAALRASLAHEGDVGATDIGVALEAATHALAGVPPEDAMLVYLGDGVITSGTRKLDALRARLAGKVRFIGVGVGDGPDTETLEALAAATGGYATTIDLADDLGWRAFDLVAALHTARVTGVEARLVDANGALVPSTLYLRSPQVADGEELELVARLAGTGAPAAVELTGTQDGAPWQRRIALDAPRTEGSYLPRLWAQRHIAARMLAKHEPVVMAPCTTGCPSELEARQARDEVIRKEVVALGTKYFLLSRHTSLIVLENDAMYAKYGVTKGAGDTWAPYVLPATIPVVATGPRLEPTDVADDAELVRSPLEVFPIERGFDEGWMLADNLGGMTGSGRFGTIGAGAGVGTGRGYGPGGGGRSRLELGLTTVPTVPITGADSIAEEKDASPAAEAEPLPDSPVLRADPRDALAKKDGELAKRQRVTTDELREDVAERGPMRRESRRWSGAGPLVPQRLTSPTDQAYDDLTAFVPALFADASDAWRAELEATPAARTPYPIEDAARTLLANARRALPSGVYRWDELEIAVDGARRLGWRRTTDTNLVETASFDGTTWTRRYAELGLDVTRSFTHDDLALALAYLPVWIAEPAHYAHWFEVRTRGPRQVTLSRTLAGTSTVVFTLEFDARHRLLAVRDATGRELVGVTWGDVGPTAARILGDQISVGFTGQAIPDAPAWAHGSRAAQEVVVELPARLPAYWQARVAQETTGGPAWRHAQRQLMVSLAAVGNRVALVGAYDALRVNGGVARGDLALASGGLATATTDAELATALAPFADAPPIARYLMAGRAYGKDPRPARMRPAVTAGLVGALWQLREITALVASREARTAVDRLVAMGGRALQLRLVAAASLTYRPEAKPEDIARAWESVAVGAYRNVARSQAALAMANRGDLEGAADRVAALVADLDLRALPPRLEQLVYQIQRSRRGQAGWQMIWATWRDRVLAGTSYDHVMSLLAIRGSQQVDLAAILARAIELAGPDVSRKVRIVRIALQAGLTPFAQSVVEPLLATGATRELYQLAATIAQAQSRTADALAHLEAAQQAAGDEAVGISTVRAELAQILGVARQLALQSSGAARAAAVQRALTWGARWRAIDPGNPDIDRQLGELLLAVGDEQEAWRQLSSVIERDPMSGTGYQTVAETFERQGRVEEALAYWQQAIVIDQTNPTHRLRKAQALIALGRTEEGDALLTQVANGTWHDMWNVVSSQARHLLQRGKQVR